MTDKEIFLLREKYCSPSHISKHCDQVAKVAEYFALKIKENGFNIDIRSLLAASKLHDLLRICDIKNFEEKAKLIPEYKEKINCWREIRRKYPFPHWIAIYKLLYSMGKRKIARITLKHNFLSALEEKYKPKTIEEKLLYYADKRVAHSTIVSLKDRFLEGAKRNPNQDKKKAAQVKRAISFSYNLEKEILKLANLKNAELID